MSSLATPHARSTNRVRRALAHPLLAPLNQPLAWEQLTSPLLPAWSWSEPKATVVRVVDEIPGVRSIWLRPNRRFGRFMPGQHVMLTLEIDGARHARCFSLSDAPRADGLLRLTIRAQPEGRVSAAAHRLAAGEVVHLSKAQGQFSPGSGTQPLLLVSAGTGVTPMMSILQSMATLDAARDVVLVHSGRGEQDTLFAADLTALAVRWPRLRLHLHDSAVSGRLDASAIARSVPDWAEREAMVCGPVGLMQAVIRMYAERGLGDHVQSESFGRPAVTIDPQAAAHSVHAEKTKHMFTATAGHSLLDAAEAAGLSPRYGCRRGICRTCQCTKLSGRVRNLLTGEVSGDGEELIQLCISTPQSAIEINL